MLKGLSSSKPPSRNYRCVHLTHPSAPLSVRSPLLIHPLGRITTVAVRPNPRTRTHRLQIVAMDGTDADRELCVRTLDNFYSVTWNLTGQGFAASTFSFPAVAQMSAYAGRGDAAFGNISAMISHQYSAVTPTSMDNEGSSAIGAGSDVVNIDPCAVAAAADAVHKLMLQSYHGVIRIFPAIPAHWDEASFHRLRAQRGFEVTAMRRGGVTRWFAVRSIAGAPALQLQADFGPGVAAAAVDVRCDVPGLAVGVVASVPVFGPGVVYALNTTLPVDATVLIFPSRDAAGHFVLEAARRATGRPNAWGWHDGWGPDTATPV